MKLSRLLAIRFLVAVACGIASVVLGSTSAAADDGPDLAAIDRYVRSEMDAQHIPGLALGIVTGTASCTCRASDMRTGPDGR